MAGLSGCGVFVDVPLCYQETEYTCGVACLQSILARYGIYYRQTALADVLHSQPIFGTDTQSILSFAQMLGFQASMAENLKIESLQGYINAGITPMLILQAWAEDEIEYPLDWKDAHYILACGYYDDGIYAMDPYTLGNYTYLPYCELAKRWHTVDKSGVRHLRSGLILQYEQCPVKYRPSVIKYLG